MYRTICKRSSERVRITTILLTFIFSKTIEKWNCNKSKEGWKINMSFTKNEKSMLKTYLLFAFLIAWSTELILILLYHTPLATSGFLNVLYYIGLGFGCGMAPAYAAFIVERKYHGTTPRMFLKKILKTVSMKQCIAVLALFGIIQFFACALQERYIGNPWYLFILFMPLMIYGGGLEEVGWQGILQPLLQKQFPFLAAVLIEGIIWSVWHLPLWFIPASSQSTYSFAAFTLFCITLGATLAAAHRITGSIWVSVLLHAWSNTVLGGMYSLTSLCSFPNLKTLTISTMQILVVMALACLMKIKPITASRFNDHTSE